MRTARLLLRQQRHIQGLLGVLHRSPSTRAEGTIHAIEAVTAHLALEDVVLRSGVLEPAKVPRHHDAHVRARIALFRVATSPTHSVDFCRHVLELQDLFGARARDLVRTLLRTVPVDHHPGIDEEFDMLHLALTTSRSPDRIAVASARCLEALRACAA